MIFLFFFLLCSTRGEVYRFADIQNKFHPALLCASKRTPQGPPDYCGRKHLKNGAKEAAKIASKQPLIHYSVTFQTYILAKQLKWLTIERSRRTIDPLYSANLDLGISSNSSQTSK